MPEFHELLRRNRSFAASADLTTLTVMPDNLVMVLTCVDPRVEPAGLLGVGLGDAIVLRNVGGRVDDAAIADIAFLSAIGEALGAQGPPLEVAVVHHTQCGAGFLADPAFRRGFADRTGLDEQDLAARAVTDPEVSVRGDVARLLTSPMTSSRIVVSGHVLHLETGLVETVLKAATPSPVQSA